MGKFIVFLWVSCCLLTVVPVAFGHGPAPGAQYGYSYDWGGDPVISQALGNGYLYGPGWDISVPGWFSLSREHSEKLKEMRDKYQHETLALRQKLLTKQMELTTLWAQPAWDVTKAKKLSNEVADLQAELGKKRGQHIIRCREQIGGDNWTCPGVWLGVKYLE